MLIECFIFILIVVYVIAYLSWIGILFFVHINIIGLVTLDSWRARSFSLSLNANRWWHKARKSRYLLQFKTLLKTKSKINEILSFLLHHTTYFLLIILAYFVTTQLYHFPCVFGCIVQKITISQNLYLFKLANFLLFSGVFLLLFFCFFFFVFLKIYSLNVVILRKILVLSIHL